MATNKRMMEDGNGLTPTSERMLKRRLVEVSALASRPAYFSAHERERIRAEAPGGPFAGCRVLGH
jgi:hypothetical protein